MSSETTFTERSKSAVVSTTSTEMRPLVWVQAPSRPGSVGGVVFSGNSSPELIVRSDGGSQANAGSLVLTGDVSFTGSAGTAKITNGVALQSDGVTPVDGNVGPFSGTVDLGAVTRTFTIADGSAAVDMSVSAQVIGSGFGLSKAGAGTLALTGENTYSGPTAVNVGTLLASNTGSGSATGTGTVTIDAGATLGGTGRIEGDTTLNGDLRTGATTVAGVAGTLNFDQDLIFGSGSTWFVDLAGAGSNPLNFDRILGGGALDLSGAFLAVNDAFTYTAPDSWVIANSTGGLGGTRFSNLLTDGQGFAAANGQWFSIHYNDGAGTVTLMTAVPEPSQVIAIGLLLLLGLWFGRRRMRELKLKVEVEG